MKFTSAPLRIKLVAALILPVIVVAGYLALRVDGAFDARQVASRQEAEVVRYSAVADLSQAISSEQIALVNTLADSASWTDARATTDAALAVVRNADLDPAELAEIELLADEVTAIRLVIGDDADAFRLQVATEIATGETDDGVVAEGLRLSEIGKQMMGDYDFDRAAIADVATARGLNDIALVQSVRNNFAAETTIALGLASISADNRVPEAIEFFSRAQAATTQSLTDLSARSTPELRDQSAAYFASDDYIEIDNLRVAMDGVVAYGEFPVGPLELVGAGTAADAALGSVEASLTGDLLDNAASSSRSARWDLVRSSGLGAGLFLSVILILIALYRSIRDPLARLTERSKQIADVELPDVVQQMRTGDVDTLPQIEPLVAESNDEIGALVHAFNGMHRTAVELASEQAASRRVVADMFVNLGRRNQRLLNRMLKGLTSLERNEPDPDTLAALYDIDHLATRMRRNAESLLILAGASQARRWKNPVKAYDVVRASLAEVEGYNRVQVDAAHDAMVHGDYVADLTHLLAELVENALSFSPTTTKVEITTRMTNRGFVIVIADEGLGMTPELLASANARISAAAGQDETPSEFLGHFVVGRLAARHGIEVELLEGVAGGLTARIVLPQRAIVVPTEDTPGDISTEAVESNEGERSTIRPSMDWDSFNSVTAVSDRPLAAPTPHIPLPGKLAVPPSPAGLGDVENATFIESAVTDQLADDVAPVTAQPAPVERRDETPPATTPAADDLTVFGSKRRTPGAQIPAADTLTITTVADTPVLDDDPDSLRTSLSSFQSATARADKED